MANKRFVIERSGFLVEYNESSTSKSDIIIPSEVSFIHPHVFVDSNIESVTFPKDIMGCFYGAFYNCKKLKTITFTGKKQVRLGGAFVGCDNIEEVNFVYPDMENRDGSIIQESYCIYLDCVLPYVSGEYKVFSDVKSIASYAFANCKKITKIILNEEIEEIDENAFSNVPIKSIFIPKNVKKISFGAFKDNNKLTKIEVSDENKYYTSIDGVLYNKKVTKLIAVPEGKKGEVVIPDSVKVIYYQSFNNCSMESITLPPNVSKFTDANKEFHSEHGLEADTRTFYKCKNLKKIIFKNKNLKMKIEYFYFTISDNNGKRFTTNYLNDWMCPTSILYALKNNFYPSQLTADIRKQYAPLLIEDLLNEKERLEWKEDWAKELKKREKDSYALLNKKDLITLFIQTSLLTLDETLMCVKKYQNSEDVEFISSLLEYQNKAFSIDDVMEKQMEEALIDTSSEKYLSRYWKWYEDIDEKIILTHYIGDEKDVIVPSTIDGKRVIAIGKECFYPKQAGTKEDVRQRRKEIVSINMPDGIKSIDSKALWSLPRLEKLILPSTLSCIEGVEYQISRGLVYDCPNLKELVIPEGIKILGKSAFSACHSLEKVSLPSSLIYMGEDCFGNCTHLTSINIPEKIGLLYPYTFWNCNSLTSLTLPESVVQIDGGCFGWCKSLTITIPETVARIADYAFEHARSSIVKIKKNSKHLPLLREMGVRIRFID